MVVRRRWPIDAWQRIYSDAVLSDLVVTDDVSADVIVALHRATHVTLHALGVALAHLDLTASEQNVLAVLADGSPRAVGELATATGTRPTTLTSVLDRLERRRLLGRKIDPADRRSFLITLTPAGRKTASAVRAAVTELERRALASLTPAQVTGFLAVTRALTQLDGQQLDG
jgi:MarR family transcriptional regulator, organic hydroperoxide resistance regulator